MLNLPNLLSICRILLVPPLVVVLLTKFEGKEWWGLGLFLLAAVMDFLDGFLARRRQQVTRLGTLLDPAADKILVSAAFISLVEMDHRRPRGAGVDRSGDHRPRVRRRPRCAASPRLRASSSPRVSRARSRPSCRSCPSPCSSSTTSSASSGTLAPSPYGSALLITVYSGIEYFVRFGQLILRGEIRDGSLLPAADSRSLSAPSLPQERCSLFTGTSCVRGVRSGLIARLTFDTDILSLLPRRNPAVKAYVESLQDFGSSTLLIVAVRIPEGAVAEPYETLADELAARLASSPSSRACDHRIGDPEELLRTFFPKSVLFLDEAGAASWPPGSPTRGSARQVSELRRQLATPQGLAAKQLVQARSRSAWPTVFLGRVQSSRGTLQVDWTSGYYLSRDHRLLLILAEPVRPPQNITFNERLATEHPPAWWPETLADWEGSRGRTRPPAARSTVGGPHLPALGDASLIRFDMIVNIATSALGVFLLFLIAFRRSGPCSTPSSPCSAGSSSPSASPS